eukprot:2758297-Prymnesium_polylepis.1
MGHACVCVCLVSPRVIATPKKNVTKRTPSDPHSLTLDGFGETTAPSAPSGHGHGHGTPPPTIIVGH